MGTPEKPPNEPVLTVHCGQNLGHAHQLGSDAVQDENRFWTRVKIAICESEASEAQYWLEVIKELGWLPWDEFRSDYEECGELLAIFTSIGKPG